MKIMLAVSCTFLLHLLVISCASLVYFLYVSLLVGLDGPNRHAIDTETLRCSCGALMCQECGWCSKKCRCPK